jgi:hypothetical protein
MVVNPPGVFSKAVHRAQRSTLHLCPVLSSGTLLLSLVHRARSFFFFLLLVIVMLNGLPFDNDSFQKKSKEHIEEKRSNYLYIHMHPPLPPPPYTYTHTHRSK